MAPTHVVSSSIERPQGQEEEEQRQRKRKLFLCLMCVTGFALYRVSIHDEHVKSVVLPPTTRARPSAYGEAGGGGLNILVIGKDGSGKSTLIRGLFGEEVRRTAKMLGVPSITSSDLHIGGKSVKITFWNSPEIYDGISEDRERVSKMRGHVEMSGLVIYALRMDDTRLRPEDIETMQKLSKTFGDDLWKKAIVALTFANRVFYLDQEQVMTRSKEHVQKRHRQWEEHVHENLRDGGISKAIIKQLPVIPVGYFTQVKLFSGEESWIRRFVRRAASRMQEDCKSTFLKLTKFDDM